MRLEKCLSLGLLAITAALAACDTTSSATPGPAGPLWRGQIATDRTSNETVLFAGFPLNGLRPSTTTSLDWGWNGISGWSNLVENPIPRFGTGAYSPLDRGVLFYSPGNVLSFEYAYADLYGSPSLWLRQNHDWTNISTSDIPTGLNLPLSIAYDAKDNQMLLLGRVNPQTNPSEQLWAWSGHSWTKLWSGLSPQWITAATDGGVQGLSPSGTSEWSGSAWKTASLTGKGPTEIEAAGYLPSHKEVVVYSVERLSTGPVAFTYVFDGKKWKTVNSLPGSIRLAPAMAADGDGNLLLYGGQSTAGVQGFSDTWSFDGSQWKQVAN